MHLGHPVGLDLSSDSSKLPSFFWLMKKFAFLASTVQTHPSCLSFYSFAGVANPTESLCTGTHVKVWIPVHISFFLTMVLISVYIQISFVVNDIGGCGSHVVQWLQGRYSARVAVVGRACSNTNKRSRTCTCSFAWCTYAQIHVHACTHALTRTGEHRLVCVSAKKKSNTHTSTFFVCTSSVTGIRLTFLN